MAFGFRAEASGVQIESAPGFEVWRFSAPGAVALVVGLVNLLVSSGVD